jgi:hypothetical protein
MHVQHMQRRHAGHYDWRRPRAGHHHHMMHDASHRWAHHQRGNYGIGYGRPAIYNLVAYDYGYHNHYAFRPGLIHALMHGAGHRHHSGTGFDYGHACRSFYIPYGGTWYRATNC